MKNMNTIVASTLVIALLAVFAYPLESTLAMLWLCAGAAVFFLGLIAVALLTHEKKSEQRKGEPPQSKSQTERDSRDEDVGKYAFRNVKDGKNKPYRDVRSEERRDSTVNAKGRDSESNAAQRSWAGYASRRAQREAVRRAQEEAVRRAQRESYTFFFDEIFNEAARTRQKQRSGEQFNHGYGFNNQPSPTTTTTNYYDTLGIPKTATTEEIKAAFRKKAKTCHPDLFKGDKAKEAEFKKLNEAYHALSGKGSR